MAADLEAMKPRLRDHIQVLLDESIDDADLPRIHDLADAVADLVAEVEELRRHRDGAAEIRSRLGAELDDAREELRKRPTVQAWERLMREHQELQARLNRTCHQLRLAIAAACAPTYPDDPEELAHG